MYTIIVTLFLMLAYFIGAYLTMRVRVWCIRRKLFIYDEEMKKSDTVVLLGWPIVLISYLIMAWVGGIFLCIDAISNMKVGNQKVSVYEQAQLQADAEKDRVGYNYPIPHKDGDPDGCGFDTP